MKIIISETPTLQVTGLDGLNEIEKCQGYDLKVKSEFHVTVISFPAQKQMKNISEEYFKEVLDFFTEGLEDEYTFTITGKRVLRKFYQTYNTIEVSAIQEIECDAISKAYSRMQEKYSEIDFGDLFLHVTTHTLNGRGIGVTKETVDECTIQKSFDTPEELIDGLI